MRSSTRIITRCIGNDIRPFSTTTTPTTTPLYIVYGASGGIGSDLVRRLTQNQENAHVVLAGRNLTALDAVTASLPPSISSTTTSTHAVDVLDPISVDQFTAAIIKQHGHVDGVVNCIGSVILKSAHATTLDEFHECLQTNLYSSFNILKSSVKAMMKNEGGSGSGRGSGGSIVFCSSAVAQHGLANHEAIAAAKGGISAMALSAAATYAPKNIRINCVAPGLTRTPLSSRITSNEAALKASIAMHALKRIGEPEDVAEAIEFLLKSRFITGQVLAVDGGLSKVRSV